MGRRLAGDHPSPAVATSLSAPSLASHEQRGIGSLPLSAVASRRAKLAASAQKLKERASLEGAAIVGVNRVKRVFQVHGAAAAGPDCSARIRHDGSSSGSPPVAINPNGHSNHQANYGKTMTYATENV